jgi:hypothetical protein
LTFELDGKRKTHPARWRRVGSELELKAGGLEAWVQFSGTHTRMAQPQQQLGQGRV